MISKRQNCSNPPRGLSLSIQKNKPQPKKDTIVSKQKQQTKIHFLGSRTPRNNSLKLIERISQKQKRKIEFICLSKGKDQHAKKLLHEKNGSEIKILNKKNETQSLMELDYFDRKTEQPEVQKTKKNSFFHVESDRKSPSNSAVTFKKATLTASKRSSLLMMENDPTETYIKPIKWHEDKLKGRQKKEELLILNKEKKTINLTALSEIQNRLDRLIQITRN